MQGLNIHIQSFRLNSNIFSNNDKIRVSITSIPEEYKEVFVIDAKKIDCIHHFFTINITPQTKKIIFVFRKKSFFQNDPIIASTIIHAKEFPQSNSKTNTEMKTVNIYEPISGDNSRFSHHNRRIYGQMQIQFSLTDAFPTASFKSNFGIEKIHNGEGYAKVDMYSNANENQYQNNSLFVDPCY